MSYSAVYTTTVGIKCKNGLIYRKNPDICNRQFSRQSLDKKHVDAIKNG